MFQYMLGKAVAKRNNTDLVLDLTHMNHRLPTRSKYPFRDLDLDIFDLEFKTTPLSRVPKILRNPAYLLQTTIKKIRMLFGSKYYFVEKNAFTYDEHVFDRSSRHISGFGQNLKYFKGIETELKKGFSSFRYPMTERSQKMLSIISSCNSISVNFRRTSYLAIEQAKKLYGEIDDTYYQTALDMIANKTTNGGEIHVFVFSDDIEWCKNNFKTKYPTTFVEHDCVGKKFSDYLRLMMACKHNIIPNSTFAWWAAWLNPNKDKIVIGPKEWVTDINSDTSSLFEKDWIRL